MLARSRLPRHVYVRDDERHDLFSCPEGLRFDDRRHRQLVHGKLGLGTFELHYQIHNSLLVHKVVLFGEEHDP